MEPPDSRDDRQPGRFYDVAEPDRPAIFQFERLDPPNYRVMRQFAYVDKLGHTYVVPKDVASNKTDFASIPFFLTWLVPKDGTHTPAAVLHDALIGGQKDVHYETSAPETVPDRHADYLFREAMKASGVAWLRRWIMWAAVSLRTLTVRIYKQRDTGEESQRKRWGRIVVIGVVTGAWALLSAIMALDVPDLIRPDRDLPWIGAQPWWEEILRALAMIAVGVVGLAVIFGITLHSVRGLVAGALAGMAVGFLGLPMIASLLGVGGYMVLEAVASKFAGSSQPSTYRTSTQDRTFPGEHSA
jgi:Protein of unknown function (DUF1353)